MVAIVKKTGLAKPIHLFVVGVSRYRHLADGTDPSDTGNASQLEQLTSAARSATEFAAWALESLPATRLASLYINVAPSPNEVLHPSLRDRLGAEPGATRDEVVRDWKAFYADSSVDRDATVFIYAAGHGVQLGREGAILLLEDFGVPGEAKLWAALDLVGMNQTLRGATAAALQYWFVDCCREQAAAADYAVSELRNPYVGFDEPEGECQAAPIFFATLPRELAWARRGGVSLFNEALLKGLRRDAATRPQAEEGLWCVTTSSLARAVNRHVKRASEDRQEVHLAGHVGTTDEVIHVFAETPSAHLTLTLNPASAYDIAAVDIDQDDTHVVMNARDWPVERELPAGVYIVRVTAEPGFSNATRSVTLMPPSHEREVKLT